MTQKIIHQVAGFIHDMMEEAMSLLVEAILGSPVKARADHCSEAGPFCGYADGDCYSCFPSSLRRRLTCYCGTGHVCCEWANSLCVPC